MTELESPRRRKISITLRELFLVVLIVALGLALLLQRTESNPTRPDRGRCSTSTAPSNTGIGINVAIVAAELVRLEVAANGSKRTVSISFRHLSLCTDPTADGLFRVTG